MSKEAETVASVVAQPISLAPDSPALCSTHKVLIQLPSRSVPGWQWVVQVRGEVAKHRGCLERLRNPVETIVRTLDKALYTIGREIVSEE
jgi:hypothetical protein